MDFCFLADWVLIHVASQKSLILHQAVAGQLTATIQFRESWRMCLRHVDMLADLVTR
jgi:hypothetical protein